eukprot:TRINITY_DN6603_c0_g1_i13.p1 TRINITY_DN6603_c0_g1~~TRINITY_DN6603_c0_g1_i13.p1  ORF type:complete len:129 (-),score=31.33 TRINITY_DN6603_c0_g1_i13:1259-1645(-)
MYHRNNREKILTCKRMYYKQHEEARKQYFQVYNLENKMKKRQMMERYSVENRIQNKEKIRNREMIGRAVRRFREECGKTCLGRLKNYRERKKHQVLELVSQNKEEIRVPFLDSLLRASPFFLFLWDVR